MEGSNGATQGRQLHRGTAAGGFGRALVAQVPAYRPPTPLGSACGSGRGVFDRGAPIAEGVTNGPPCCGEVAHPRSEFACCALLGDLSREDPVSPTGFC